MSACAEGIEPRTSCVPTQLRSRPSAQRTINYANDIVYTHDLTGRYTSLNLRGQQITGYSPDEIGDLEFSSLAGSQSLEI